MGRVIDALIAYRLLKLLVTPFKKTKAYKMGIIDEKGKVLIKSKEFLTKIPRNKRPEARKSYTLLIRFVFNLKRLLSKVGIRGPLGSAAAAAIAARRPAAPPPTMMMSCRAISGTSPSSSAWSPPNHETRRGAG